MSRQYPETFMLATECVKTLALGHVPDANCLVFGVGNNQLGTRVEQNARNVVVVATTGVNLQALY